MPAEPLSSGSSRKRARAVPQEQAQKELKEEANPGSIHVPVQAVSETIRNHLAGRPPGRMRNPHQQRQ